MEKKLENLIYLRKQEKLSQEELGEKIGVKKSTICEWENGHNDISIENLKKLANYFDVAIDFLLDRRIKTSETNNSNLIIITNGEKKEYNLDNKKIEIINTLLRSWTEDKGE